MKERLKNTIKKSLEIVMFWVVFFLVLVGITYVITPNNDNIYDVKSVTRKTSDIKNEKNNSIDVVFLGDSMTYSSVCPLLMYQNEGITSYVMASSAQRLCDTKVLLEEVFREQSPKVVVVETGVFYRNAEGKDSNSNDFVQNYLENNYDLFRYHSRWKALLTNYATRTNNDCVEAKRKGYRLITKIGPYTGGPYMQETNNVRAFSKGVEQYMDDIVVMCEQQNVKLVLMSVPSPVNWSMRQHNSVEQYAEKHNLEYIDANLMDLNIDWSNDTKDKGDHLNLYGACKYTSMLGDFLSNNYELEDHRRDKRYGEWNKSSKEFYELLKGLS